MIRRKAKAEGRRRGEKADGLVILGCDVVAAQYLRTGKRGLEAFFPGGDGPRANKPLNLQFLDHFDDETMRALSEGFAIWNVSDCTPGTRDSRKQNLKYGFVDWMRLHARESPNIAAFDEELIARFATWIGDENSKGFVEDRSRRHALLFAIEEILFRLQLSDTWGPRLSKNIKRLVDPFGSLRREHQRRGLPEPREKTIMGRSTYDALWDEAATRVETDMAKFEPLLDELNLLREEEIVLDATTAALPAALATWLLRKYGNRVRSYGQNSRHSVYRRIVTRAQHDAAEALLYPRLEILVPYLYLTTAFFALNASVVLNMKQDDYILEDVPGGGRRLRIFPKKPRADSRQRHAVAETDDPSNPAKFLPFLERRTAALRRFANPLDRGNAFIYFEFVERCVMALRETTSTFGNRLRDFAKARSVDKLSLKSLRLTTLDVVHDITNGDIVATRAFANHKTVGTTHTDYRTEAMRNRYEERQGEALEEWERFWGSGGKVDMIARAPSLDRTAATPGYGCLDPMSSPVPGEKKGRLCRAFGQCPACELAVVLHKSPHAFRCLQALLTRIEEAEVELHGPAYLARYAEVKTILVTDHLKRFGKATRHAARDVVIPLIPKLD